MTTFQRNSLTCLLLLLVASCIHRPDYHATDSCKNFVFLAHTIFPNERVILKYNNEVILDKTPKDHKQGYYVYSKYCLPKVQRCKISITTFFKSKKYIDTSFIANTTNTDYILFVTIPYPFNWKEYYKGGFLPKRKWKELSIDSCIRFVKFEPDTIGIEN